MPRTIVICCDGTSNQFGPTVTNVLRLVQLLECDSPDQVVHYQPGVGTLPEPGYVTPMMQWCSIVNGLAFGAGLTQAVEDLYAYLMEVWEPGDRVFLFGFSRGAYTVRVLAAMLHELGLLPRCNQNMVPYAMRLFRAVRSRAATVNRDGNSNYWKLSNKFRSTFARPIPVTGMDDNRRFPVEFMGVWDTVSSVGWVWEPATFPYTASNPSIRVIRHAVSIDERRCFFRQNLFHGATGQDLEERWFSGAHADVGGGYPEGSGEIWRNSLEWMLAEAVRSGLQFNAQRLAKYRATAPSAIWLEPQHESLKGAWWLAEYFPKKYWSPVTRTRSIGLGMGRSRTIPAGALLDKSALLRIREMSYSPPNFAPAFLAKVRSLPIVPDTLAFEV